MKKQLTQLAVIYTAAVISGVFAFTFVSNGINALAVQQPTHTARTVVTANIQGGSPLESYELQPAFNVEQPSTVNPQPNTVGGNGQDIELQPALGYGALNWVIQ